ncbi:hypothetical protein ABLE91_26725 [Aquabacter sp. CN5-332]|uniref:hypothetical protein n=1 Tax=Aquabacter sp. CN5-332 TaxID=3156608 RepID=UPI0032B349AF
MLDDEVDVQRDDDSSPERVRVKQGRDSETVELPERLDDPDHLRCEVLVAARETMAELFKRLPSSLEHEALFVCTRETARVAREGIGYALFFPVGWEWGHRRRDMTSFRLRGSSENQTAASSALRFLNAAHGVGPAQQLTMFYVGVRTAENRK